MTKIQKFKAFFIDKDSNGNQSGKITDLNLNQLMEGDTLVKLSYSSLNYKDGLAILGKLPIIKKWPMIPGVDFVGKIVKSSSKKFEKGDMVILNGWGLGESHYGGYSQYAQVNSKWLVHLPPKISEKQSMIIGSAGYTAMLCVMALIKKLKPHDGKILVTGASGGVGSFSVFLLSRLGFNVEASTGKSNEVDYLKEIGATTIIDRNNLGENLKPLNKQIWAGAIDTVGSKTLADIISKIKYNGVIAATGLAQGPELNTTVFPFILRNISLIGIDSVYTPIKIRKLAWKKLEENIHQKAFKQMMIEKKMEDLKELSSLILKGKIRGRVIINLKEI